MNDIKYEHELYTYIKGYLENRGIHLLQNEVSFRYQLKDIDLLAKKNVYYLIEVKRDQIIKKDYYNLKYIIENNNLGEEAEGILIGNCRNKELKSIIENSSRITLITIDEVKKEIYKSNYNPRTRRECYDESKKYFRWIFSRISNRFLSEFLITNDRLVKIVYTTPLRDKICFRGSIINNEIKGDIYQITTERYFGDLIHILIKKDVYLNEINGIVYKKIVEEIYEGKYFIDFVLEVNKNPLIYEITKYDELSLPDEITRSLDVIFNLIDYISSLKLEWTNKYSIDKILKEYGYGKTIGVIRVKKRDIIWYDYEFDSFIKDYMEIISKFRYNYNLINLLEFTNLIIDNKLIRINKEMEFINKRVGVLTLSVNLNNGEKYNESYKVYLYSKVKNADFYLFSNYDIIIHFQRKIDGVIKGDNLKIVSTIDYIDNEIRNKIVSGKYNIKTLRNLIEEKLSDDDIKYIFKYRNKNTR